MNLRPGLRVAALALVAVATWEVLARGEDWWTDEASPWGPYSIQTLFRSSPEGREGVPHARFGKWRMNGLGFRGEEPLAGREVVVAFGASETFGQHESPGHEFPRRLAAELQARFPGRFDVQNAALPGMRIGRIAYLHKVLEATRPRYVVIYPTPANYIGAERPLCHQPVGPIPSGPGRADGVRILGKIEQLVRRALPEPLMTGLREADIWWATRREPVASVVPEDTIRAFRTDLECAVDVVLAHGALPVLATHATYFGGELRPADRPWMVAWRRFYPGLSEEGFLDLEHRANEQVRDVARLRDLPVFDAATELPRGRGSFADFAHFTDAGSGAMARGLAAVLARRAGG
jgi:hypothetical protein